MTDTVQVRRFPLKRPPPPWGLAILLGLVGLSVAPGLDALPLLGGSEELRVAFSVLLALVPPLLLLILWPRPPAQQIEVLGAAVRFPAGGEPMEVDVREIDALILDDGPRPGLYFSSSSFATYIPASRFPSSEIARAAYVAIRERIAALPDGAGRVSVLERVAQEDEALSRGRPFVTESLVALNVVAFALMTYARTNPGSLSFVRFGVNARVLVADGQLWRLLSANFLHANWLHLVVNGMGLLSLGVVAERLLGPSRFLAVYLGAGIMGAAFSAALQEGAFSLGASTSIFGLFSSLLYLHLRFRDRVPLRYRISDTAWLWMIILNAVMLRLPFVDVGAHVGGVVGGLLLTMLVVEAEPRLPLGPAPITTRLLMGVLSLGFVAAGARAVVASRAASRDDDAAVMKWLIGSQQVGAAQLNELAWFTVLDAWATPAQLELARRAAELAVDRTGDPGAPDTLATAYYRLGDVDRAIALESDALIGLTSAQIGTQHMRFLLARRAENGPLFQGLAPLQVKAQQLGDRLILDVERASSSFLIVDAVALRGGEPVGLVRFVVPPEVEPPSIVAARTGTVARTSTLTLARTSTAVRPGPPVRVEHPGPAPWGSSPTELRVGLVRTAPSRAKSGTWLPDPEVLTYP